MFSSFGLVHSKLHNKLGNDKAAKLTLLFKTLNQTSVFTKGAASPESQPQASTIAYTSTTQPQQATTSKPPSEGETIPAS